MIENMKWLSERWKVFFKRLLFCYESSMLGELLSVVALHHYITTLNRSRLSDSKSTAVAVYYYVWSLVGHGFIVLGLVAYIICIRALWAFVYVSWKHQTLAVFFAPCCVDTTLALPNKMTMLGGYLYEDEKLYYTTEALKAFGLLKMKEGDGAEFVVLRKIHWLEVPTDNLFVIGFVAGETMGVCAERPCTGIVSFFDQVIGGDSAQTENHRSLFIRVRNKVAADPKSLNVLPSS